MCGNVCLCVRLRALRCRLCVACVSLACRLRVACMSLVCASARVAVSLVCRLCVACVSRVCRVCVACVACVSLMSLVCASYYIYLQFMYVHMCCVLIRPPIPYITSSRCKRLHKFRPVEILLRKRARPRVPSCNDLNNFFFKFMQ